LSLLGIFRYLSGYVDICVKGDCAEQFINLCAKQKITVWRIRKELGILKMRMSVKDYKQIRALRKKSRLKFKITLIKKHGIRFHIYKYRKRKGILVGLILFFAFLIFMSNFIWTIEVKGNKEIQYEKIISTCRELGIYDGVYKGNIDTYNLPIKLILKLDGIAWCSFNIEGSKLTVEISEAKVSEKEDLNAANLIAARDGVIEKLEITDGVKMVKIGQAVRKGDLIASGLIDNGIRTYTVKADGQVIAKTERSFDFTIPKFKESALTTGKKKSRRVVNFFGIKIPLYIGNIKYEYIDEYYEKRVELFGGKLPIRINTRIFNEVILTREEADASYAENVAIELLAIEAKKLKLHSVKISNIDCQLVGSQYKCSVTAVCSENISEYQQINIDNKLKNR